MDLQNFFKICLLLELKKCLNGKKIRGHRTRLRNKLDQILILGHFETSLLSQQQMEEYPVTLFDALKVIQCVAFLSFFSAIFMVLFEGQACLFSTFQETVGSQLKGMYLLVRSHFILPNILWIVKHILNRIKKTVCAWKCLQRTVCSSYKQVTEDGSLKARNEAKIRKCRN